MQAQFRTGRDALETKIGERIEESSPIIEWLVKLAADLTNRFQLGEDGRTNFQRWKMETFNEELPEFGEKVMFKTPDSKGKDKGNVRWRDGHYLGVLDESNELLIGLPEGVIKVRDVMRHAGARSWDAESLKLIKGTPRRPHNNSEDDQVYAKVKAPADEGAITEGLKGTEGAKQVRRYRMNPGLLKDLGLWTQS